MQFLYNGNAVRNRSNILIGYKIKTYAKNIIKTHVSIKKQKNLVNFLLER